MSNQGESWDEIVERGGTPTRRLYSHPRGGGGTLVSGGDYDHICDPYWTCTATYCCGCGGFVPLTEVTWANTGETVAEYRARLRRLTPGWLAAWRSGLGAL